MERNPNRAALVVDRDFIGDGWDGIGIDLKELTEDRR